MQYVSATEARNSLSRAIDMARREPVVVQKQGRDVAVILSPEDYARITQDNVEEFLALCDEIGQKARARGLTDEKLAEILADKS